MKDNIPSELIRLCPLLSQNQDQDQSSLSIARFLKATAVKLVSLAGVEEISRFYWIRPKTMPTEVGSTIVFVAKSEKDANRLWENWNWITYAALECGVSRAEIYHGEPDLSLYETPLIKMYSFSIEKLSQTKEYNSFSRFLSC